VLSARPRNDHDVDLRETRQVDAAVADAAAVAFGLLASLATAGFTAKARQVLQPKIGSAHAAVIRYAIVLLGGLATILITLQLFGIGVTQLLSAARSPRCWSA
jgi:hypothetical protein